MNIQSDIQNKSEENLKYVFTAIEDPSHYSNILQKENYKLLEKWGLIQNMELMKFRFNINFDSKNLEKFLKDLMYDKTVRKNFEPLNNLTSSEDEIKKIKYANLSTKSTSTDLFNCIYENGICSRDGYIKQDYEDYFEEISIADKLKQALLIEDSENYCVFNEETRNEFLFHIFKRLVTGGSLSQYEEYVTDYMQLTKLFYKDMMSVIKDPNTGEISIRSIVLEILNVENSNLYKIKNHPQNFFYIIIEPIHRHVHIWYHKWIPYW